MPRRSARWWRWPGPTRRRIPTPPEYWAVSANLLRSARRLLRRKERERAGRFLAEGPQAVAEALTAGAAVEILAADEVVDRHSRLLDRSIADGVRVSVGPSGALADLTDTVHP